MVRKRTDNLFKRKVQVRLWVLSGGGRNMIGGGKILFLGGERSWNLKKRRSSRKPSKESGGGLSWTSASIKAFGGEKGGEGEASGLTLRT